MLKFFFFLHNFLVKSYVKSTQSLCNSIEYEWYVEQLQRFIMLLRIVDVVGFFVNEIINIIM